jgi:hypothetical protein
MRLPRLSHVAPEEILLVPVVLIAIVGVLLQPGAITRLFESPYATPAPDAPGRSLLREPSLATPSVPPSPAPGHRPDTILAPDPSLRPMILGPGAPQPIDPCQAGEGSHTIEMLRPEGRIAVYDRQGSGRVLPDLPGQVLVITCGPSSSRRPVNVYVGPGAFAPTMCPPATIERVLTTQGSNAGRAYVCLPTVPWQPETRPVPTFRRD